MAFSGFPRVGHNKEPLVVNEVELTKSVNHYAKVCNSSKSIYHLAEITLNLKDTIRYFPESAVHFYGPRRKPYTTQIYWTCAPSVTTETERSSGNSDGRHNYLPMDSGDRMPVKITNHNITIWAYKKHLSYKHCTITALYCALQLTVWHWHLAQICQNVHVPVLNMAVSQKQLR